jgi:hypothetical protein
MFFFSQAGLKFASKPINTLSMKKTIYYCLALCFVFTIYNTADAQVRKLPAEVTEGFKTKYPNATNVEWRDRLSGFTAAFDLNNTHYEARFTNKGVWQNTETKIAESELPAVVKDGFSKSKYASEWSIKEAYKIEIPEDHLQYRLHIKKSDIQQKKLLFNSDGRMIKDNITI